MFAPLGSAPPSLCVTCAWRCSVAAAALRRADTIRNAQRRESARTCSSTAAREDQEKASRLLGIRAHYWDSLAWQLLARVEPPRARA